MTDRAFATQLIEDIGPAGLRLVAEAFRGDAARLQALLAVAAESGDVAGFRRAAHGLAGAAGAVGAVTLERACRAAMNAPATDALADLLGPIAAGAEAAMAGLAQLLAEYGETA